MGPPPSPPPPPPPPPTTSTTPPPHHPPRPHDHTTTHARACLRRAGRAVAERTPRPLERRSNAAASDLHREVDARQGAVVGQAAGLASGARCQSLRRGDRRPHLPPAARSARRKSKPRVPAKVKGGREWSSKDDAQACGESWQAAGACAVRVGAARA